MVCLMLPLSNSAQKRTNFDPAAESVVLPMQKKECATKRERPYNITVNCHQREGASKTCIKRQNFEPEIVLLHE